MVSYQNVPEEISGGRMSSLLARGAALIGQKHQFQLFLSDYVGSHVTNQQQAALWIRRLCNVRSRRELDSNPLAGKQYGHLIKQFNHWLGERRNEK